MELRKQILEFFELKNPETPHQMFLSQTLTLEDSAEKLRKRLTDLNTTNSLKPNHKSIFTTFPKL